MNSSLFGYSTLDFLLKCVFNADFQCVIHMLACRSRCVSLLLCVLSVLRNVILEQI